MSRRPFIILTLILLGHAGAASGQGGPLTLEDIVTLERVASAVLSPDGQHIAYVLNVPRTPYVDENGSAYRELHITDLDGNSRGFITGEVNIGQIAWSVDGEAVYYLAERNDDDEYRALYGIPVAGGESRRLYSHDANIQSFQPSPDGRHIGFLATEGYPSEREQLANLGFRAVVYGESSRFTKAWVVDLESEEPEAVAAELPGTASDFHWAPGGERYLVALAPTPSVDDSFMSRRFHIVDAQSGEVLNRFETEGKLGNVAWSPDGRRIAFVGAVDMSDPLPGRIHVAAADGEGVRALTPGYPGHVADLEWRDAETLWYRGSRGLWNEIGVLAADGTLERSPIFHAGNSRTPLLILGGDSDTRVNPSQSLQLYQTLKLRTDTPVRLVVYPGEGHGNSRTAAQLDYAMRMTRWMDHYLMGPGGEAPPYELDHAGRLEEVTEGGE